MGGKAKGEVDSSLVALVALEGGAGAGAEGLHGVPLGGAAGGDEAEGQRPVQVPARRRSTAVPPLAVRPRALRPLAPRHDVMRRSGSSVRGK